MKLSSIVIPTVFLLCSTFASAQEIPLWVDATAEAGIAFDQIPDPVVPYGGGTVWSDIDNDGWEDLFLSQFLGCSRVFRNLGDGTFEPYFIPGLERECDLETRGASMADYDNDGDQDLYLAADGQNRLLRNELIETGAVAFTDVTREAGMVPDNRGNSASAVWGDFDADGFLDLFVTNHSPSIAILNCGFDQLYHNRGDGTFRSVGRQMGVSSGLSGIGCGLAATWSDYDSDGDQDLMVVNDFGYTWSPNRLFRNDGPGDGLLWRLTDVSFPSGFDYRMFGMGIAPGDYDRDGDLDYYAADIGDNNLANNQGDGTFVNRASQAGVLSNDFEIYLGGGLVSWGGVFADLDRDGWEDLLVSNGGAPADLYPGMFGQDYVNENPVHIYRNRQDETFAETHQLLGFDRLSYHRSVAVSDYDQDGDLDIHFGMFMGENVLYRQDGPLPAHWLSVSTRGTVGNRDGIGAKVQLTSAGGTQIREISGGSSFLANNSRKAFFGLDQDPIVDHLIVQFLSGATVELFDVAVDQTIEVVEPPVDLRLDGTTAVLTNHLPTRVTVELGSRDATDRRVVELGAGEIRELPLRAEERASRVELRLEGQVIDRSAPFSPSQEG